MSELVFTTFFAALLTALATGLGALPFIFVRDLSPLWQGRAAALAGGMMLSASVFSLSGEALQRGQAWELALELPPAWKTSAIASRSSSCDPSAKATGSRLRLSR